MVRFLKLKIVALFIATLAIPTLKADFVVKQKAVERDIADPSKVLREYTVTIYLKDSQFRVDDGGNGVLLVNKEGMQIIYVVKDKSLFLFNKQTYKSLNNFSDDVISYANKNTPTKIGDMDVEVFEKRVSGNLQATYWVSFDEKFKKYVESHSSILQKSNDFYESQEDLAPWLKDGGFYIRSRELKNNHIIDVDFVSIEEKELDEFLFALPTGYTKFEMP